METVGPTGVEMEALTAVQVALLTIYDMCKAAGPGDGDAGRARAGKARGEIRELSRVGRVASLPWTLILIRYSYPGQTQNLRRGAKNLPETMEKESGT